MKRIYVWLTLSMAILLLCGIAIYLQPSSVASSSSSEQVASIASDQQAIPPEATPTVTTWRFPDRAQVGTVVIGGMTEAEARAALNAEYNQATMPLTLVANGYTDIVKSSDFGYTVPIEAKLIEARDLADKGIPVRLALEPIYDLGQLRRVIDDLSQQVTISPTFDYDPNERVFVITDGLELDHAAALNTITQTLQFSPTLHRIELPMRPLTMTMQATPEQVLAAIQAREAKWGGTIAVSVYDLKTKQGYDYNGDIVFSGMSLMKIPILLQAYMSRATFTPEQREAIDSMIDISDNMASNDLLAMIGDGDALKGVEIMNTMLAQVIGTEHTFLAAPYESIEYLALIGIDVPARGPEGPEPRTDADPYVRTTPNEINMVVKAIVDCADGDGVLLKMQDSELTPSRCQEMLDILTENEDINKIVAGVPKDSYVAHKSGWIDDARADAGYVRTPEGGEYIISIWMWDVEYIETVISDKVLSDLSRIVYTAQYPIHR